jgi:hypothetical protein
MNDAQPEDQKPTSPDSDAMPEHQSAKFVVESASPALEEASAKKGKARPADPQDADDVLTQKAGGETPAAVDRDVADAAVLSASRHRTRRAFVGFGAAALAAYGFRRYLEDAPFDEMIPGLLHKTYAWNADVSRTVFRDHALAPTYPRSRAETLRVNGVFGLKMPLMPESYRLQVVGVRDATRSPFYT